MSCQRRCLIAATCASGGLSLTPGSLRQAVAADAAAAAIDTIEIDSIEINVGELREGELKIVHWQDKPVWVLRRSPQMLASLSDARLLAQLADPDSEAGRPGHTPSYARNPHRSIDPMVFVGVAVCPHAGCQPVPRLERGPHPERQDNWPGGFTCQCHFATFDLAGRVFKGKPARENIPVPRHMYRSATQLVIGRDESAPGVP